MGQVSALGEVPHERRLLEASVLLPAASRLHPHPPYVSFRPYFAMLIYGRFRELTRGISLIYGTRACRQGDFGGEIYPLSRLAIKDICHIYARDHPTDPANLPYIRQIVSSRPSIDHQIVGNRDQLNPTTCSATKYPLRITKRPLDPRKFNARDMAFLRTSL